MSRQIGNRFENEFMVMAEELGYATFAARGSRGPIDCLCFQEEKCETELIPLAVQVGTTGKAISKTLDELLTAPRPIGSLCLVARRWGFRKGERSRVRWTFHSLEGKFDTLEAALHPHG